MDLSDNPRFSIETLFAGGRLCLDFINTACQRRGTDLEFLGNVEELIHWLRSAEIVHKRPLMGDSEEWSVEHGETRLAQAKELRAALHDIAQSVLHKQAVPASALRVLNATLQDHPTYSQVSEQEGGFTETTSIAHRSDAWLAAIAQDAVDLLCHSDLSLLRQCECPTCVRKFFDTTKNHRRRWCVEKCGSAPKAAAYYRRKIARSRAEEE